MEWQPLETIPRDKWILVKIFSLFDHKGEHFHADSDFQGCCDKMVAKIAEGDLIKTDTYETSHNHCGCCHYGLRIEKWMDLPE